MFLISSLGLLLISSFGQRRLGFSLPHGASSMLCQNGSVPLLLFNKPPADSAMLSRHGKFKGLRHLWICTAADLHEGGVCTCCWCARIIRCLKGGGPSSSQGMQANHKKEERRERTGKQYDFQVRAKSESVCSTDLSCRRTSTVKGY